MGSNGFKPACSACYNQVLDIIEIDSFILEVEAERGVALESGFLPVADQEQPVLERLCKKFPELGIDPKEDRKIIIHARASLNAHNN